MTDTTTPTAADLLAAAKLKAAGTSGTAGALNSSPLLETKEQDGQEEKLFQCYASSKPSIRTITPDGFRITFTNFQYLTQNEDAIAFLDEQIARGGLPGITKGEARTFADLNPMAVLKRKHYEEFTEEQAKLRADAANGIVPDSGKTVNNGLGVVTTKQVAS